LLIQSVRRQIGGGGLTSFYITGAVNIICETNLDPVPKMLWGNFLFNSNRKVTSKVLKIQLVIRANSCTVYQISQASTLSLRTDFF
jgi:hypothetical protein